MPNLESVLKMYDDVKKNADMADIYINTGARLELINDDLQTQAELQEKIFAAADRSQGAYSTVETVISEIGLLAGDAFKGNDELNAFTGLIQKAFKAGGASTTDQSSALLQLAQALVTGKLQGAEFLSIMKDAPMIASAFANNWSWIAPIIWGIVTALGAYNVISLITDGIVAAQTVAEGVKAAVLVMSTGKTFMAAVAQEGLNAALLACPITWIIIAIIALIAIFYAVIAAINHFAGTSISATGIIAGAFMAVFAFIGNLFITAYNLILDVVAVIWNFIAAFVEFLANVFIDPIGSIVRLFSSMADSVLEILQGLASAVDTLFGTNLAGSVSGWRKSLKNLTNDLAGEAKIKVPRLDATALHIQRFEYGDAYNAGYKFGQGIDNKVASLGDMFTGAGKDDGMENIPPALEGTGLGAGMNNEPLAVKGMGADGAVDVNMADEDLQYMRDIAEREYINKFSTATLAPNVAVSFGDVHETADADQLAGRIRMILQNEIAMASEGVYDV